MTQPGPPSKTAAIMHLINLGLDRAAADPEYRPVPPPLIARVSDSRKLPPGGRPLRWTARRKAAVLLAVTTGQLSIEEACRRYELTEAELAAWLDAFKQFGTAGLRATKLQAMERW